jgi:hypothetical protein
VGGDPGGAESGVRVGEGGGGGALGMRATWPEMYLAGFRSWRHSAQGVSKMVPAASEPSLRPVANAA